MVQHAVVALFLLTLFMTALNVIKLSSEVANFFRPKKSNWTASKVINARLYGAVTQCDAGLLYYWNVYRKSPQKSARRAEARKMLVEDMSHTMRMEDTITLLGNLLFGTEKSPEILKTSRPDYLPYVDDWNCLDSLVKIFEKHCGSLNCAANGWNPIANFCNAGIKEEQMARAAAQACPSGPSKT